VAIRVGLVSVRVETMTAERWSDLVRVFGRRGQDPGWCWCQLFLRAGYDSSPPGADNRSALRAEIATAAVPPGLIAYVDDEPAGWTRVGPRSAFARVAGNRALARVLPADPGAWWVACFAVDSRRRRASVGSSLLDAAVEFARAHGATALEGHPVDVAALSTARVSGSALYTGTRAMFTGAGFIEIGRTFSSRPVMRLPL
jgi:GNAT superfamily N-acetyltransferase